MMRGDLVILRPINRDDFVKIVAWSKDPDVHSLMDGDLPESLEECEEWHKRIASDRYNKVFSITTLDGELIGDIELNHITWRNGHAEMRVRIGEKDYWDKGYGTDAVMCLLLYAFSELSLQRVYLRVYGFNHRAIRCYEKCNFKKEGRLRRTINDVEVRDIVLMRVMREEFLRKQLVRQKIG